MEFRNYDDIRPTDRVQFPVLFYSAQRSLHRLERKLHKLCGPRIPMGTLGELLKLSRKIAQMTAAWKQVNNIQ